MTIIQLIAVLAITILLNFLWLNLFKVENQSPNTAVHENYISNSINENDGATSKKQSRKVLNYIYLLLAIFPLLGGLWAMNYWLSDYNSGKDSLSWDEYDGRILEKTISQCSNAGTTGHQLAGRTYRPTVKYEFTYNNKLITWDKISFLNFPCSGDKDKSQKVLDNLPDINEEVKVYFSAKHKQSVLITGTENISYFGLIGGVFFYCLGLIGIRLIYS